MDNPHFFRLLGDQLTQETVAGIDAHLAKNAHVAGEKAVLNAHTSIIDIWPVVRPILLFIQGVLFFKPDWVTAIRILIAGMDAALTPTVQTGTTTGVPGLTGEDKVSLVGQVTPIHLSSPAASNNAGADEQQH